MVPRALMDTLMFEHGVRYGQTVHRSPVTEHHSGSGHAPPVLILIAHMSTKVSQYNDRFPRWSTLKHHTEGLLEVGVLRNVIDV